MREDGRGKKSVLNSIRLHFLCNEREGRLMKYPEIHPVSFLLNQQWNSSVLPRQRRGNSGIKFPHVAKETQANSWWWAMIFWKFNCCWSLYIRLHFDSLSDSNSFNYAAAHTMFGINKIYFMNQPFFAFTVLFSWRKIHLFIVVPFGPMVIAVFSPTTIFLSS